MSFWVFLKQQSCRLTTTKRSSIQGTKRSRKRKFEGIGRERSRIPMGFGGVIQRVRKPDGGATWIE